MECPICKSDRSWVQTQIEVLGKCGRCYADAQPLVKMPGGSYLPWSCVNHVHLDGSVSITVKEDVATNPIYEGMVDRTVPKVSFCEKYKKWRLSYTGDLGEIDDNSATMVERYFDTKEEIFELMTKE